MGGWFQLADGSAEFVIRLTSIPMEQTGLKRVITGEPFIANLLWIALPVYHSSQESN